ncbi:MAG: hypothetical protein QN178_11895 [Armatimonadota bacterium]|nr:hypothetical protein [Armatimonadota bacterium]
MPADLTLMNWICEHRGLARESVVGTLKAAGHKEADIVDSYEAVIRQTMATPSMPARKKEPWLAALLSFILPGMGHLYAGAVGTGIVLLALYGFAWLMTLSIIGAIIGVPLLFAVAIGALVGSYNAAQAANRSV